MAKILKNSDDIDHLIDLLNDPDYNPFEVSRALEALAYGKAVVTIDEGKIILTPINDNKGFLAHRQMIRTA